MWFAHGPACETAPAEKVSIMLLTLLAFPSIFAYVSKERRKVMLHVILWDNVTAADVACCHSCFYSRRARQQI